MSLQQISDPSKFIEELKGLSPAEVEAKLEAMFYITYGRYESMSGKMYFEMYHNGSDDNPEAGMVRFKKGLTDEPEPEENLILTRTMALQRYNALVKGGFERVFKAVTQGDMDEGNAKRRHSLSNLQRENVLGTYVKADNRFVRIAQYGELYSVERGYNGHVTSAKHDLDEQQVRDELNIVLSQNFRKPGTPEPEPVAEIEDITTDLDDWEKML